MKGKIAVLFNQLSSVSNSAVNTVELETKTRVLSIEVKEIG